MLTGTVQEHFGHYHTFLQDRQHHKLENLQLHTSITRSSTIYASQKWYTSSWKNSTSNSRIEYPEASEKYGGRAMNQKLLILHIPAESEKEKGCRAMPRGHCAELRWYA